MNILYLTMAPIDESSGVYKKIRAQVEAFGHLGHTCKLLFVRDSEEAFYCLSSKQEKLSLRNEQHVKFITDYLSTCDFCYARFELLRHKYYKKIIDLCIENNVKVVTEIPTYPPYQESIARVKENFRNKHYSSALKTLVGTIFVVLDMYRMTFYSKLVVMIADDKKFRFADTIRIENGIDVNKYIYRKPTNSEKVRIIAVSNFSIWNGYDLALEGLRKYIDRNPSAEIELILVGEKQKAADLIAQVKRLNLQRFVKFTGALSGKQLDDAFKNADIALCALGNHRRKVFSNSSLKAKEYASRGMLMVMSDAEGIEREITERSLVLPSHEEPLDFDRVIKWYMSIDNKDEVREFISKYAQAHYSWEHQLIHIIEHK